ncbi:VPLPA-CTERM sorting domain-containing protein [Rubrimonas cliftonensis]|uniref:VPLPA-CTERM protein sorting domain-containing protein n=1 Tax=Rubrimonas cliftonensis TaxID=89524 RepID=A0A1H3YTK7_9RHOB|nr:VPLPA-CTERM sorting domain-containing protein [Rubrimonas cliftonensis]SEA14740.1 VPLPA-CTERM protein sorting domain-containing protein [Rubrimonas cliftonensis]
MKTLVIGLAFGLLAASASAATVSVVKTALPIDLVEAQSDVLAPTSFTAGKFLANQTGSIGGVRRSPYDSVASLADSGVYNSVQGGGSATYLFDAAQDGFSILWGSPDAYNTLSFFLGGTQIDLGVAPGVAGMSITGAEVAALPVWQPQQIGLAQVVFSGFEFDEVVLASGGNAFEYGLVSTTPAPVPLPAAAWLLAAGLGALGLLRRRATA